jgi:glycopeptide antibiotics resistance protein
MGRAARRVLTGLLILYLLTLVVIAFWPVPVDRGARGALHAVIAFAHSAGLPWVSYDLIEGSANVVLFLPSGLLLGLLGGRGKLLLLFAACVAASLAIELGQAVFLPDRFASPVDVGTNSLGAAIGLLLAAGIGRARARRTRELRSRRGAAASVRDAARS